MYSGSCRAPSGFAYGAFTLSGWLSQNHSAKLVGSLPRSEPQHARTLVWALPVSLAATPGIDVSFSSSGYLDVSVHRVPLHTLWIGVWMTEGSSAGFPHSDISGSMDICSSPKLFAAYHVFLRLLVPRHPPCALSSLTRFTCPRVRSDLSAHSVAPLVGSFFFTHLSVCLGCLSSILIFKILDLFQYAVFKVRYLTDILSVIRIFNFLNTLITGKNQLSEQHCPADAG